MTETPKPQQLPEAPASASFKYIHPGSGGEILFTLRHFSGTELIARVDRAISALVDSGATIVPHETRGGGNRPARIPVPSDGTEPICPTHNSPMRKSQYENGGYYCAKQNADGTYCKQKAGGR